jgi:hypothetical protein
LILFQGVQPIEKVRECVMLTTARIHTQTTPAGLCILALQRHGMSNTDFHEFQKSLNVRSSARHHAQSLQVILHSYIPRNDLLPCIHYTGFSIVSLSRKPQKTHIFLMQGAVGAIFPELVSSDGYDIRVPGVKADAKMVFMGIIRSIARHPVFVLRQGP